MKLQDLNISYHILYHFGSTKEKKKGGCAYGNYQKPEWKACL